MIFALYSPPTVSPSIRMAGDAAETGGSMYLARRADHYGQMTIYLRS